MSDICLALRFLAVITSTGKDAGENRQLVTAIAIIGSSSCLGSGPNKQLVSLKSCRFTGDAVIDFDAVARDPRKPDQLKAEFSSSDHIHLNDAGYKAMAAAIDLSKL
jgi:hypothetical protein